MYLVRDTSDLKNLLLAVAAACVLTFYIFSAGGCDSGSTQIVKETSEPQFARAQEELRRGNEAEAMSAFLKVIEKRKDAPESHLEVGRICLSKMNDPVQAIYHFRKYLEMKPNSQQSPMVRQMVETAQKKFAASLPESPFETNIKRMEMEELVQKLQKENLELKQKLALAAENLDRLENMQRIAVSAQRNSPAPARAAAPAQAAAVAQPTRQAAAQPAVEVRRDVPATYVVQSGDTLSSISRKVYGSSGRWKEIYQANRDRLASPEALKVGQTLRIPK